MASWNVIKPILVTLGPTLGLTYGPRIYRALFTKRPEVTIRPVPAHVARAQNILFVTALVFLVLSFPSFAPENLFLKTKIKHIRYPTADIFDLLSDTRSPLTELDQALKKKLASRACRVIYAGYGPDALANCAFCSCEKPHTFFYYSVAGMLFPHLLNTAILGWVTALAGKEGMRWRNWTTILSVIIASVDLGKLWAFDTKDYDSKIMIAELDFLHWRLRTFRYAALFLLNVGFYALLWATSTNRFLAQPPSISERLEDTLRGVETMRVNLHNIIALRSTVVQDSALRAGMVDYWRHDEQLTQEVLEEPEVVQSLNEVAQKAPIEDIRQILQKTNERLFAQLDGGAQ